MRCKQGFSIIEIVLIAAMICLLGMVAVPQLRNAQSRARAGQVRDDLRQIATALEAYHQEWNIYPYDGYWPGSGSPPGYYYWYLPPHLSTPVAYLANSYMPDPFRDDAAGTPGSPGWVPPGYRYVCTESTWGTRYDGGSPQLSQYRQEISKVFGEWRVMSSGPDGIYGPSGWFVPDTTYPMMNLQIPYDATNGLASAGDIVRSERYPQGYGNMPE